MKKLLSLFLAVPVLIQAQSVTAVTSSLPPGTSTVNILSRTNYSSTTGDTLALISIKAFDEVNIVATATDSVCQIFNIDGYNTLANGVKGNIILQTYQDSLAGTNDTLNVKSFYLTGNAGDRFPGCDLIRIRAIGSAKSASQGTTSGRVFKVFLKVKKQSMAR